MAIIDLVRHAEGWHNIAIENQLIQDPVLTERGVDQCDALCERYAHGKKLAMLVSSPMHRTIQTCLYSFGAHVPEGTVLVTIPELQELSTLPSDVGSDKAKLEEIFSEDNLDLSRVTPGWNNKGPNSPFEPTVEKIQARALKARLILRDLTAHLGEEDRVVVVSHGSFIHFLTEDFESISPGRGTGWDNTEFRSYVFADATGADPNATLQETAESRTARLGHNDPVDQGPLLQEHIKLIEEQMAVIAQSGRSFKFQ